MLPQNLGDNFTLEEEEKPPARTNRLCRCFSLAEIQSATEGFNEALVIGKGGFGKVYKGFVDNMQEIVAIKRLKPDSKQGKREFWTEIEMLSELRHVNLVSLIGYCNEQNEMILVYEHMPCGTLADHLYKLARKGYVCLPLSWKHRLNICIGAARGLDYLHTGNRIIHRDVKASNILLDQKFVAKVSDFGLAKIEIGSQASTNVVKGTFGYFDPDYLKTRKLTTKCDTYSFGVVLLEVLCGRPAVEPWAEEDKQSLTMWARDYISKGEVEQIIAPSLRRKISPDSLKTFVLVAGRCLRDDPKKRPAIANVVLKLEVSLKQQENAESLEPSEITSVADGFLSAVKVQHQETPIPLVPNEIAPVTNVRTNVVDAMQKREKSLSPNEIAIVANTTSHSNRNIPSVRSRQLMTASSSVQNVASALKEKNKSEMISSGKKAMHKLSHLLPPWNAVWSSVKPPKRKDSASLSISAPISRRSIFMKLQRGSAVPDKPIGGSNELIVTPNLRIFSFSELKAATRNFRSDSVLGVGGFGSVYKGWIHEKSTSENESETEVAVKQLSAQSVQGFKEWKAEVEFLGRLSHPNLVKLLGYCLEDQHMLLVYELMPRGSLEAHLFRRGSAFTALPWEIRLKILIGVARVVAFLHGVQIIFRDLKLSNILLDKSYNPKLSDFGLAKDGPAGDSDHSHVTTRVMGTYGYAAPEYLATGHLYIKSDVYSFGVIIVEMLTGLRAFDERRPSGQHLLVDWIKPYLRKPNKLKTVMDSRLQAGYPSTSAFEIAQLARDCLQIDRKKRPSMQQSVEILERLIDKKPR